MAEPTAAQEAVPKDADDAKRLKAMQAMEQDDKATGPVNQASAHALGEAMKGALSAAKPEGASKSTSTVTKVNQADVAAVAAEMEIPKATALDSIRRAGGSKKEALRILVKG